MTIRHWGIAVKSLKPSVAYLVLNFCAFWKKQTTLPSLAYAGIPYQVFGERAGAWALTIAWIRSPMAIRLRQRSDFREHGAFPVPLVRIAMGEIGRAHV